MEAQIRALSTQAVLQNASAVRADGSEIVEITAGGMIVSDAHGNRVFAADETSGFGLASPWIPFPTPLDTNVAHWPSTTATTMTNISNSNGYLQHPSLQLVAQGYAPASTTGVFAFYINGTQVGSTWTATNGGLTTTTQNIAVPAPTYLNPVALQVYAQVTAGTGAVAAQVTAVYGRQT